MRKKVKINLQEAAALDDDNKRVSTGFVGLDYVLGGGFVSGSVTLIQGPPGVGKTRLALGVARNVAKAKKDVVYIVLDTTIKELSMTAGKLYSNFPARVVAMGGMVGNDDLIRDVPEADLLIVDPIDLWCNNDKKVSLVTAASSAASMKRGLKDLSAYACEHNAAVLVMYQGPKSGKVSDMLGHMVDVVCHFDMSKSFSGLLRTFTCKSKNRFARIPRQGLLAMTDERIEDVDGILYDDRL